MAVLIQFMAWVILIVSFSYEQFNWFLLPNVDNTPAFITVSKWLIQSLIIANLIGYLFTKLISKYRISELKWKFSTHLIISILHIIVLGIVIYLIAGYEDL